MKKKDGVKIAAPLKSLNNCWRSLEMPLINCKVEHSLNWIERCILTAANTATLKILMQNFMFQLLLYQQKTM